MDVAPQGAANGHSVVLLHGNNFGVHALLGDLYARTGLPREADEAYEQARDLASPSAR